MVVFGNQKYACLSCIRGHRSSSCEHRQRILLQVRKPGRRSQADLKNRCVLVWKESPMQGRGQYKLMKIPENGLVQTEEDDDVVLTEKYVFVHVGNNLFRRELKPSYIDPASRTLANEKLEYTGHRPQYPDQLDASRTDPSPMDPCMDPRTNPSRTDPRMDPRMAPSPIDPSRLDPPMNEPTLTTPPLEMPAMEMAPLAMTYTESKVEPPTYHEHHHLHHDHQAPLVIGPMQFQNEGKLNVLNELGLSEQEAAEIWPRREESPDNDDFSYAVQCVLPGQCQCGDTCACPDCYEHNNKH